MVKPLLSQGMRNNWQKNLAHLYFRKRSMKLVIRDARLFIARENNEDPDTENDPYLKKMFHKYKRWEQVLSHFTKGLPISLVVLRHGFIGAVVHDRDSWMIVPVRLNDWVGWHAGLDYFRVSLFERDHAGNITRQVINFGREVDVACYVLMLPLLKEEKYVVSDDLSWTIVGSEYERLAHDGTLQTIYEIPINMQEQPGIMLVNNVDGQAQPPLDDHNGDGHLPGIL
jgi:hypothetical protein